MVKFCSSPPLNIRFMHVKCQVRLPNLCRLISPPAGGGKGAAPQVRETRVGAPFSSLQAPVPGERVPTPAPQDLEAGHDPGVRVGSRVPPSPYDLELNSAHGLRLACAEPSGTWGDRNRTIYLKWVTAAASVACHSETGWEQSRKGKDVHGCLWLGVLTMSPPMGR